MTTKKPRLGDTPSAATAAVAAVNEIVDLLVPKCVPPTMVYHTNYTSKDSHQRFLKRHFRIMRNIIFRLTARGYESKHRFPKTPAQLRTQLDSIVSSSGKTWDWALGKLYNEHVWTLKKKYMATKLRKDRGPELYACFVPQSVISVSEARAYMERCPSSTCKHFMFFLRDDVSDTVAKQCHLARHNPLLRDIGFVEWFFHCDFLVDIYTFQHVKKHTYVPPEKHERRLQRYGGRDAYDDMPLVYDSDPLARFEGTESDQKLGAPSLAATAAAASPPEAAPTTFKVATNSDFAVGKGDLVQITGMQGSHGDTTSFRVVVPDARREVFNPMTKREKTRGFSLYMNS